MGSSDRPKSEFTKVQAGEASDLIGLSYGASERRHLKGCGWPPNSCNITKSHSIMLGDVMEPVLRVMVLISRLGRYIK